MRHRRVGLHQDTLLLAVLHKVEGSVAHMGENLVHHRLHAAMLQDVIQIGPLKVRDPYSPQFPSTVRLL